jgi:hypothetical protein
MSVTRMHKHGKQKDLRHSHQKQRRLRGIRQSS